MGPFIAGVITACGAVIVMHGLETVKMCLQLQGELTTSAKSPRAYTGIFQGATVALRDECLRGPLGGLPTAYSYRIMLNGCWPGFYEPIRATLANLLLQG